MPPKILFLHGVGNGEAERTWLDGLNRGLATLNVDPVAADQVIAPEYAWLLSADIDRVKAPENTYKVKKDTEERRAFFRRQSRVERLLTPKNLADKAGLRSWPDALVEPLQNAAIASKLGIFRQVSNYMKQEALRSAILRQILKDVPKSGELILIGHSLGSIVAIDLIDHLPPELKVTRFITIGSPAGSEVVHKGHDKLLKRFPYARVDDWSNIYSTNDPVTAGRGLASTFKAAQDFRIRIPRTLDNRLAHKSEQYLEHPAVATLIADALDPPAEAATTDIDFCVRLDDTDFDALLALRFADRVKERIADTKGLTNADETATRFGDALDVLKDQLVESAIERRGGVAGLPPEMAAVQRGEVPSIKRCLETGDAVRRTVTLAYSSLVDPFEIEVGSAAIEAIPDFFSDLGFTKQQGREVEKAIEQVTNAIAEATKPTSGPWAGRTAVAAAGVAIVAMGPFGILGTAGGLAVLAGLTGTGSAVAATAGTLRPGTSARMDDPRDLAMRVAISAALRRLDEPTDPDLWNMLTDAEALASDSINRLGEFSDPSSLRLKQQNLLATIGALIFFAQENGLVSEAVEN
ncbi:GPI inositol-deacylase [Dietzia cinnamea]|uniref:GPI inositol-deacylase n=1 Tax=Dietzia cinnamea TaxID=321318 RepID=UPI00223BC81A|nr:GPI inositol-deacylase [Dietzia cinnamea]MCT2175837.1 GPI inositol-deacylase [Dietzia cinnamea]